MNKLLEPKVVIKHYPYCKKVFVGFDAEKLFSLEEIDFICDEYRLDFSVELMMIIVLEITEFNAFNEFARRNYYEE